MRLLLLLLLLLLSHCCCCSSSSSYYHPSSSLLDLHPAHPCNNVNCGRGKCVNQTLLLGLMGYSCHCDPGWASPFGLPLAPCVVPNCTVYQSCDNRTSLASPPPYASPPVSSPPSVFNACFFPVCGHGQCISHSLLSHTCECDPGYLNIFNLSSGYCLRECQIGGDCRNIGINIKGNSSNQPAAPPSTNKGIPPGPSPTIQVAQGPSFPSSAFMQIRLDNRFMMTIGLLILALCI